MEDREGTNQRPQLEREDSTTALLSDSNREKESFPMACTKRTIFSAPEAGRSPRVIEASIVAFPPRKKEAAGQGEGERRSIFKRLSGSALCKMTVIVYIAGCVLVSALYVALYGGQSQKLFAASDAWIPGKVSLHLVLVGGTRCECSLEREGRKVNGVDCNVIVWLL